MPSRVFANNSCRGCAMKKLSLIILLSSLLLSACGGSAPATPAPTLPPVAAEAAIGAEGQIVPLESVNLSFGIGGEVSEVLVKEGDAVKAGDVIARLRADSPQAAVAQAEAG